MTEEMWIDDWDAAKNKGCICLRVWVYGHGQERYYCNEDCPVHGKGETPADTVQAVQDLFGLHNEVR